eukprot:g42371.t1
MQKPLGTQTCLRCCRHESTLGPLAIADTIAMTELFNRSMIVHLGNSMSLAMGLLGPGMADDSDPGPDLRPYILQVFWEVELNLEITGIPFPGSFVVPPSQLHVNKGLSHVKIYVAFLEGSLQGVFETLPLSSSSLSAFLKLDKDDLLWQSELRHPKHVVSLGEWLQMEMTESGPLPLALS